MYYDNQLRLELCSIILKKNSGGCCKLWSFWVADWLVLILTPSRLYLVVHRDCAPSMLMNPSSTSTKVYLPYLSFELSSYVGLVIFVPLYFLKKYMPRYVL